jgi:outer membrane protein OmpA-like peptidoglycan-associated protein
MSAAAHSLRGTTAAGANPLNGRMVRTTALVIAFTLLSVACKKPPHHQPQPGASVPVAEVQAWGKLERETRAKVVELRKNIDGLENALYSTPAPRQGELLEPLVVELLQHKLEGHARELHQLEVTFDAAQKTVTQARERNDSSALQAALASTTADYSKINIRAESIDTALGEYRSELGKVRFQPDTVSQTKGAELNVSEIDFRPGTADIDTSASSKAALERLIAFAKRCSTLTFEISGHTSRSDRFPDGGVVDHDQLSLGRAEAVKRALIGRGVNAPTIVATKGLGSTSDLLPEPAPDSAEAKAMNVAELELIRSVNRRVEVDVVTPCP